MLDSKGTFDEIVARLAPSEREREEILSNPIYRELSSAVAGSQELSAMVKLYELRHERDFDVIVLDTPPSRNAVDFLDTPTRLLGFLEGRALKVFLSPGGLAARVFGRSTGIVFAIFARVTGVDMLSDLSTFFRSLSGILEAFGQRTRGVAELLREHGVDCKGELWAMMLDSKGTFDEIVARLTHSEREREEILANPIYRELSSAVAGSQELSAMVKLYELRHERDFDVIVLDTPPSRNAVDFLETPTRLLGFLEGRALKVFLSPSGLAARVFGRSTGIVFAIFARVTGVDMLSDLSTFFRSLSGILDGFGERTRGVAKLLRERTTTFFIVTSPEHEPAREAQFLAERLAARNMSRTSSSRCGTRIGCCSASSRDSRATVSRSR
jgi:anion-transporting  ArsA/GET3 family ATPase